MREEEAAKEMGWGRMGEEWGAQVISSGSSHWQQVQTEPK